jgi:hypothetical protein
MPAIIHILEADLSADVSSYYYSPYSYHALAKALEDGLRVAKEERGEDEDQS